MYDLDFGAPGADADAQVATGAAAQLCVGDEDYYIFTEVTQIKETLVAQTATQGKVAVPQWTLAMLVSQAMELDDGFDAADWYMVDRLCHPQTIAFNQAQPKTIRLSADHKKRTMCI